jgi:hypothetical protein
VVTPSTWYAVNADRKESREMVEEVRETGPVTLLLYPVVAIGAIAARILRLFCGNCNRQTDYEYQF